MESYNQIKKYMRYIYINIQQIYNKTCNINVKYITKIKLKYEYEIFIFIFFHLYEWKNEYKMYNKNFDFCNISWTLLNWDSECSDCGIGISQKNNFRAQIYSKQFLITILFYFPLTSSHCSLLFLSDKFLRS